VRGLTTNGKQRAPAKDGASRKASHAARKRGRAAKKSPAPPKPAQAPKTPAIGELVIYREFSRTNFPRRISYVLNDNLHGHLGPVLDYRRGQAQAGSYDLTVSMGGARRTLPRVKVRAGETCFVRVTGTRGNTTARDAEQRAPFEAFVERVPTKELADHLNRSVSISSKLLRDSLLPLMLFPLVVAFLFALPPVNWIGVGVAVLLYAPVLWCALRVRRMRRRIARGAAEGLGGADAPGS
jgi:hypothetical protein